MRGAWYIVDVYCFLCVIRSFISASEYRDDARLLAISAVALVMVFFLSWATYKGNRPASRILSLYIMANALSGVWWDIINAQPSTTYILINLILYTYLFIGAIKLWRIKELPTRFTDPPAESPTHG